MRWLLRERTLELDRPVLMGILNVTPDSFSDGGKYVTVDAALRRALEMLDQGADIIDVGGQSTRPQGARPVPLDVEIERVVPVIEALARARPAALISVDTVQSAVAREAIAAGAHIINDVSALRLDAAVAQICAATGAGLVLMHSRGGIADMATFAHATYEHIVDEVIAELDAAVERALSGGVEPARIALDPGVGFAKRSEESFEVLTGIPRLARSGRPIVIGASRKRFVGAISGAANPADRIHGTLGANVASLMLGAHIFRVHDVRENRDALDVAWEIIRRR